MPGKKYSETKPHKALMTRRNVFYILVSILFVLTAIICVRMLIINSDEFNDLESVLNILLPIEGVASLYFSGINSFIEKFKSTKGKGFKDKVGIFANFQTFLQFILTIMLVGSIAIFCYNMLDKQIQSQNTFPKERVDYNNPEGPENTGEEKNESSIGDYSEFENPPAHPEPSEIPEEINSTNEKDVDLKDAKKSKAVKVPYYFEDTHEDLYPYVKDDDVSSILIGSTNIFDFFESSGILNPSYYDESELGIADSSELNSSRAIIPEYGGTYGKIVNQVENMYSNIDRDSPVKDIIDTYTTMINMQLIAKEWSQKNADGLDLALVSLIARNYKERGDYYHERFNRLKDKDDFEAAISDYSKAIKEYSNLYLMCNANSWDDEIRSYKIFYWIASIYHHMGDMLIEQGEFIFEQSSFTNAESFLVKNIELVDDEYFIDYSKYYSAITTHKLYNAIYTKYPNEKLPNELKYYLHEAYVNYNDVIDSKVLTDDEKADAKRAVGQMADACIEYLDDWPDEEETKYMRNRSYYVR